MKRKSSMAKWRGALALVRDAVEHGSRAVERVQIDTAKRPFAVLEAIPPIAVPAKVVHVVHDASVAVVHGSIRAVNAVVGKGVEIALAEDEEAADVAAAEPAPAREATRPSEPAPASEPPAP